MMTPLDSLATARLQVRQMIQMMELGHYVLQDDLEELLNILEGREPSSESVVHDPEIDQ